MASRKTTKKTRKPRNMNIETLMKREMFAADLMGIAEVAADAQPAMVKEIDRASPMLATGTIDKSTPLMMQARVAGGDSADGHVTVLKSKYIDKASPMLAKGRSAKSTPMMMQASTRGERSGDPSAVSETLQSNIETSALDGHVTVLKARYIDSVGVGGDNNDTNPCLQLAFINPPGTAVLNSGVLMVTGTTGADNIEVVRDVYQIEVYLDGDNIGTFLYSDVDEIIVYGGCDDDVITLTEEDDAFPLHQSVDITVYGGQGDDTIHGSDGNDKLFGGTGDDWIFGNGGSDLIDGGAGDDTLLGGQGHDTIFGGSGNDWIWGGLGSDTIDSGTDNPIHVGGGQTVGDIVIDVDLVAADAAHKLSP